MDLLSTLIPPLGTAALPEGWHTRGDGRREGTHRTAALCAVSRTAFPGPWERPWERRAGNAVLRSTHPRSARRRRPLRSRPPCPLRRPRRPPASRAHESPPGVHSVPSRSRTTRSRPPPRPNSRCGRGPRTGPAGTKARATAWYSSPRSPCLRAAAAFGFQPLLGAECRARVCASPGRARQTPRQKHAPCVCNAPAHVTDRCCVRDAASLTAAS